MKLEKELLEKLYTNMSIDQMAKHLNIPKSTIYYYMKKFGIKPRSKSQAQTSHLQNNKHQRIGKNHTDDTRKLISNKSKDFWNSDSGKQQKNILKKIRRSEWINSSTAEKRNVLSRLHSAPRPEAGTLSKLGRKLATFLSKRENVQTCVKLSQNHISDLFLKDKKIVIELVIPTSIYGHEEEARVNLIYDNLTKELNDLGYKVFIVKDGYNSVSLARCERIYVEVLKFLEDSSRQSSVMVL